MLRGSALHTGIVIIAIGSSDIAVVTRIAVDDGSYSSKLLGILHLETAEGTSIAHNGDLALDLDAQLVQPLKVKQCPSPISRARSVHISAFSPIGKFCASPSVYELSSTSSRARKPVERGLVVWTSCHIVLFQHGLGEVDRLRSSICPSD